MKIRSPRRVAVIVLSAVAILLLVSAMLTWSWSNVGDRVRAMGTQAQMNGVSVDTRPLDVAQQLAQLAETRSEKSYAEEALRLSDYAVDFAFAAAIREASEAPVPVTPATREISDRLKKATDAVAADSVRIVTLTPQAAKAGGSHDALQQQLDVASAQRELDQDDLDDARQDLIRAGGDRLATVQRLKAQHDSSNHTPAASTTSTPSVPTPVSIELTKSSSILDQSEAWFSLNAKKKLIDQARQRTLDRVAVLTSAHDTLERQVAAEKASQQILHAKGHNAGNVALAQPVPAVKHAVAMPKVDRTSAPPADTAAPSDALSFLHGVAVDQKDLSELDKRIDNEQDLATLYGRWSSYVGLRQQSFEHGIIVALFWVLLIVLLIVGANRAVKQVFFDISAHQRQLHTVRTVTLFAVQGGGILLIVLVIFGMPSNFATVVALAGAGLALALQDFIVGFFGWFVLMGKDGIRPGDWVEINGVGGEVLEVGVFQTVLLETSDWLESADPTGRKVSFVNSFAIEGHYFNFSTSGQWLWDELDVDVADGTDPYAIAEEIQRLAAKETVANASVAEEEWRRVVPVRPGQTFSAEPSVRLRPSGSGVSVQVRYLTRASDRQQIRTRMYRAMIDLLHGKGSDVAVEPPKA